MELSWETKLNFLVFYCLNSLTQHCISTPIAAYAASSERQTKSTWVAPILPEQLTCTSSLHTQTRCCADHSPPQLHAFARTKEQASASRICRRSPLYNNYLSLQYLVSFTISWGNLHKDRFNQPCIYGNFVRPINKTNIHSFCCCGSIIQNFKREMVCS